MAVRSREVTIRHHGRTIRGTLAYPLRRSARVPAVVIVHGRSTHRGFPAWLLRLGTQLRRAGYATLAIDLSGHGASSGRFEDLTYSRAADDVRAAVRFLERQTDINEFAVGAIGHSLGGTAVLLALAHGARLRALVLAAPVGDTQLHRRTQYSTADLRAWRRTGYESWWSERAQRTFRLGYGFYRDLARIDTLRLARDLHQPILLVHGTTDRNVPFAESRRLIAALDEPKALAAVPGANHNFTNRRHERVLRRRAAEWLRTYLAPRETHVVNAFVRHRGRLLVLRRSSLVAHYRGCWAPVGGHLHRGQDPIRHARVELREELGLRPPQLRLVRSARAIRIRDPHFGTTWVITPTLFESTTDHLRLNWEHDDARWVAPGRFPYRRSYPHIARQLHALRLT